MTSGRPGLTLVALGRTTAAHVGHLVALFSPLEQIDVASESGEAGAQQINQAIDAARNDWVLLLRHDEAIDDALALELREAVADNPRAWACRIRTELSYAGGVLRLGPVGEGEVRLVHRRHARAVAATPGVTFRLQGTVVRLRAPLRRATFATSEEHEQFLRSRGRRRSLVTRVLVFLRDAVLSGAALRGTATLRYLWVEAGWSLTPEDASSR